MSDATETTTPPAPVPGCLECANHAVRRERARGLGDPTAETTADIRLRAHLLAAHGAAGPT